MSNVDYTFNDLLCCYKKLGVTRGATVYLTGNFGRPGIYSFHNKEAILEAHLKAIRALLDGDGTILVPTHSWSLCNTDKIFDPRSTPSEMGPMTQHVLDNENSVRQLHPFSSTTGIGTCAAEICNSTSRHVYGPESPFQRMIDKDAIYISVGQEMRLSLSLVHHMELVMGVPYRVVKEFTQKCLINDKIHEMDFYLHVIRKDVSIERDRNIRIMNYYKGNADFYKTNMGRSFAESISTAQFYEVIARLLKDNIYAWVKSKPIERMYRLNSLTTS